MVEVIAPGANTPLNDKFADDVDSKMLMDCGKLISAAIKGIQNDEYEIYPGIAKVMKIMSRLAPGVIFNQMSKVTDKALAEANF